MIGVDYIRKEWCDYSLLWDWCGRSVSQKGAFHLFIVSYKLNTVYSCISQVANFSLCVIWVKFVHLGSLSWKHRCESSIHWIQYCNIPISSAVFLIDVLRLCCVATHKSGNVFDLWTLEDVFVPTQNFHFLIAW